ncbi:hypothetical protein C806_03736 [Lachnospiraceae bacterium 3-1]|nr:hypothetical protein C806_03736 [Lachnospiraceae bacterium 3-1]
MYHQIINYFQTNSNRYLQMLTDHIRISLWALLMAVLIGVPAGLLCVRFRHLQKPVSTLFRVLRIVPSLAILLLMLPILGTGAAPASVALTLLAIPPILENTVAGLKEVPAFLLETADSLGMTSGQVWKNIRFPLALPLTLTGIKTAAVEIIASAALASKIGAGGFGDLIFTGIGLFRTDLLLIGGISVAFLSLSTGFFFYLLEKILLKYKRM